MSTRSAALALSALVAIGSLTACGSDSDDSKASGSGSDAKLKVVASFYPLQYAVQQIGGNRVDVASLTPPGAEPHDLELTPKEVGKVADAKMVVYAKGFQSAVDDAVKQAPKDAVTDIAGAADLTLDGDAVTEVGDHEHSDEEEHEHGDKDPHFWLDPVRYSDVAKAIAAKLEKIDPDHKADYEKGLSAFTGKLGSLNTDYSSTLKACTNKTIVTSHAAFGYMAQRYDMKQVGVMGISPDQEPTPGRLKAVTEFVKKNHVTTIYTETLASPKVAQSVAKQTGAKVATLDPIEGITKDSAGTNYFEIMRSNLKSLKSGQSCK